MRASRRSNKWEKQMWSNKAIPTAYGVEKFKPGDVHTLIDIGACVGRVSLKALELIRPARILSFEPCKETFEILLDTNERLADNAFECYNIGYGRGDDLYYLYKKAKGMRRFLTEEESIYWEESFAKHAPYPIEGKTFEQIFADYKVDADKPYMIKMDCEGCERFLLENECDIPILSNCLLFTAEFHFFGFDFDGTPRDDSNKNLEYASWAYNFVETHDIIILPSLKRPVIANSFAELVEYFSAGKYRYIRLLNKRR